MTIESILNNPMVLLGKTFPHPDCKDVLLTIVKVNRAINATWDEKRMWRNYVLIMLEDGTWCRYWLNTDMDTEIPKYED